MHGTLSPQNTFVRAWTLLNRNPAIVVPCIVVSLLSAALTSAVVDSLMYACTFSGCSAPQLAASEAVSAFTAFVVSLVLALSQMAFVTGMAGVAWRQGKATLRDGWNALAKRWFATAGAALLLFVIGLCAAALAPVSFLVTLAAYAVFFIYTMAAVVVGERTPVDGIVESARIALANVLPTVVVVALIAGVAAAGGALGFLVSRFSEFAGWLIAALLQAVIVAYASLVVAGEYLKLASRLAEPGS
jgi:hypothetical protein